MHIMYMDIGSTLAYIMYYVCTHSYVCILSVSSSVTDGRVIMITPEDATNTTYTVTCTIHPDSTADMCEVMARADGQTLTGEHVLDRDYHTYVCILPHYMHICDWICKNFP